MVRQASLRRSSRRSEAEEVEAEAEEKSY